MTSVARLKSRTTGTVSRGRRTCPLDPETVAEALVMGKLDPHRARRFARHCEICPSCEQEFHLAREFVTAIRAALQLNPPSLIYKCPPVVLSSED